MRDDGEGGVDGHDGGRGGRAGGIGMCERSVGGEEKSGGGNCCVKCSVDVVECLGNFPRTV